MGAGTNEAQSGTRSAPLVMGDPTNSPHFAKFHGDFRAARPLISPTGMNFMSRHLAPFAATLLAASLVAPREAGATSPPPCTFSSLGSNLANGDTSVPRDVNLVVGYSACGEKAQVTLLRDGVPVDATITHGVTELPLAWASVKPLQSLDASTAYTLEVKSNAGSSTLTFTTGDGLAPRNDEPPSVEVVYSAYTSPVDTAGLANAWFEIELHPAVPTRGGVLFFEKQNSTTALDSRGNAFDSHASAFAFDRGEQGDRVTAVRAVRPNEPTCFTATYEDEAGRASVASEATCVTVRGTPPAAASPDGPGGCSTTPHRPDASWALAAAVTWLMLTRGTRSRAAHLADAPNRGAQRSLFTA